MRLGRPAILITLVVMTGCGKTNTPAPDPGGGSDSQPSAGADTFGSTSGIEELTVSPAGIVAGILPPPARGSDFRWSIGIWDYKSGRRLHTLKVDREPFAMAVSPDGSFLAALISPTGIKDMTLSIWDVKAGTTVMPPLGLKELGLAETAGDEVFVGFTPDSKTVVYGLGNRVGHMPVSGKDVKVTELRVKPQEVRHVCYLPVVDQVVVAPDVLRALDATGQQVASTSEADGGVFSRLLGSTTDGKVVAYAHDPPRERGTGREVELFDTAKWERVAGPLRISDSGREVHRIELSPDAKRFAVLIEETTKEPRPRLVELWTREGTRVAVLSSGGDPFLPGILQRAVFSPDGSELLVLRNKMPVQIIDAATGKVK